MFNYLFYSVFLISKMDIKTKQRYIYENIDFVNNSDTIVKYFDNNNLNYTENSNGVFINISILEDKHIDFIYLFVKNNLTKIPEKEFKFEKIEKQIKKKEKNDIFIKNFTKEQQTIIKMSKINKLF